jgi:hypothetical protein
MQKQKYFSFLEQWKTVPEEHFGKGALGQLNNFLTPLLAQSRARDDLPI